ncbi:MAG: TraV family lipoprotein [Burkholderiaceae bacterium]|nr:TraV family lipoprotein [Burkholderiaceae bacterium]
MKPLNSVKSAIMARSLCLSGVLLLAACGNLTGLDGSSKFSCKAPPGVHCTSVTANYHNRGPADAGDGKRPAAAGERSSPPAPPTAIAPGLDPVALRSPVRVLRLWVKAWEDSDRDLVDQSFVYVRVDDGQWRLAHVSPAQREAYAPLRPPASPSSGPTAAAPGTNLIKDGADAGHGAMAAPPAIEPPRQ